MLNQFKMDHRPIQNYRPQTPLGSEIGFDYLQKVKRGNNSEYGRTIIAEARKVFEENLQYISADGFAKWIRNRLSLPPAYRVLHCESLLLEQSRQKLKGGTLDDTIRYTVLALNGQSIFDVFINPKKIRISDGSAPSIPANPQSLL
jgi:hypothetical protein